jgi:hypothetical protein
MLTLRFSQTVITKLFWAQFITPSLGAFGFDEMAIFTASNIDNYKGVEFGIRMDLKDGYIYGYIQEPNESDNSEEVNFFMKKLFLNDGHLYNQSY